ncbi:nucleotidyl transferase AbiEii/AbiGii toxin family protein [Parashewanella tropica]|uniref:nucleotidyl transferase AbiEii/AbiGii toxin family protein n=1 Tax=Parashewanella tropica TaxID=2547970 RepID=UPI001059BEC9|nr:nucleotidyl transferase AbiEii/AbiGii toxin family protein [Parashewanella tropica]
MDKQSVYYRQVTLLMRVLPVVAKESIFALKGGTAINLFVRDFPRLSVDIDLSYLPLEPRDVALSNAKNALSRITTTINEVRDLTATLQDNRADELRIIVNGNQAQIKIEVSPVARGTLHQPKVMPVSELVEDEFGYAEIAVVSLADLYGGKLCAAMDRQHPRDLYDVNLLLKNEGISRGTFVGFLTYVLGHPRPINEVMAPNWKDIKDVYDKEFSGMTVDAITIEELKVTRTKMLAALKVNFTETDRDFLLSFKLGEPKWELFDEPEIQHLPAVKWKLLNLIGLKKRNSEKHQEQLNKLNTALGSWL